MQSTITNRQKLNPWLFYLYKRNWLHNLCERCQVMLFIFLGQKETNFAV